MTTLHFSYITNELNNPGLKAINKLDLKFSTELVLIITELFIVVTLLQANS